MFILQIEADGFSCAVVTSEQVPVFSLTLRHVLILQNEASVLSSFNFHLPEWMLTGPSIFLNPAVSLNFSLTFSTEIFQ